jgi:hypothetical protein
MQMMDQFQKIFILINAIEIAALIGAWGVIFITAKKARDWLIKPATEQIQANAQNINKNAMSIKELEILLLTSMYIDDVRTIEEIYGSYKRIGGASAYIDRIIGEWRGSPQNRS